VPNHINISYYFLYFYNLPKRIKGFNCERRNNKKMMKLKSKRFCRSISLSKLGIGNKVVASSPSHEKDCNENCEIKWELRPGGMLVQKRENNKSVGEIITIRVSTVSKWHDISIEETSTFGKFNPTLYTL
jgi:hypothetical protein